MTKKIDNCPEGGDGIVIIPKPAYLLPKDYSRCISVDCPARDCARLQNYLYDRQSEELISEELIFVSDFSQDKKIEVKEDCEFYL
jgi:hypothetical protein